MTDPAIQDGREAIDAAEAEYAEAIFDHASVDTLNEQRTKLMALIDTWGAAREAAGVVAGLKKAHCDCRRLFFEHVTAGESSVTAPDCQTHRALRKAEAHYQTCQDTLKEIMGVDGRSE